MIDGWPTALDARFEPHALIGKGSFGSVFAVTDRQRGTRLAVKVLHVERLTALQAFKREFRALADLAHENLVALHEFGREGDTWFLVMELVEGLPLLDAVASAPSRVESVFAQLALGLAFLHGNGRLHRDLKPANVRVTSTGRAVLLDFGLAINLAAPTDAETGIIGSPAWLSPEQADGKDATPASDLYALGVMLCEALTSKRPFAGRALEVLAAKRAREAAPEFPETVSAQLRSLVLRLLARDPMARPTAAEVVRALDPSLEPLLDQGGEVPLVGRDHALVSLESARDERGSHAVWISAAPGIGKSALLREFMKRTSLLTGPVVVWSSRCFEHESTPFRAIDGLVDGLVSWLATQTSLSPELATHAANLARSFPSLRHLPVLAQARASSSLQEAHRHESAVALRELARNVASQARLVVVVDDLHWADPDSVPFLAELLDGLHPPALLFVGALREEGHPLLERLRAQRRNFGDAVTRTELRLTALDDHHSRALARLLQPAVNTDTEALLSAAGGNPFLLQALAGHQGGLAGAVAARIARVPRGAQRLLEAVCLAEAPVPRLAWQRVGQLDVDEVLALGHLRAGRLVRVRADGSLEPYHDTLRRAVAEQVPEPVRTERHDNLAEGLMAVGAAPESIATHLHHAGRVAEAAEQAFAGAQRAMSALAFHHAAQLFRRTLEWAPGHHDARARRVALGDALSNAGRGEEAAQAYLEARSNGAPDTLVLERKAAAQLLRTGHIDRGLELTGSVLRAHGLTLTATPRGTLASLALTRVRLALRGWGWKRRAAEGFDADELARIDVLTSSSIGLAAVDSLRAADLMGQALLRAFSAGEPKRLAVCLGFETAFSGNGGGKALARTTRVMKESLRLCDELRDDYASACGLGGAGIAYFHLGELGKAIEHLERASALFLNCPGAVKELFTLQLFSLAALAQKGALGELGQKLGDHLRLAVERGDRYAEANLRSGLPNLAWLGADDLPRARLELELARPGLNTRGYSVQHFFELIGRFHVELYAGQGTAAAAVLAEGLPALEGALLSRTEWIHLATAWMKGRALLVSGEVSARPAARSEVLGLARVIASRKRPWGEALVRSLQAGEAASRNAEREVIQALIDVERLAELAELELHAVAARWVRGSRTGDVTLIDSATRAAASLGVRRIEHMARLYLPMPPPGA